MIAAESGLALAAMLAVNVATATAGDILIASAFRQIGDFDAIMARGGLLSAIFTVLRNIRFLSGLSIKTGYGLFGERSQRVTRRFIVA
jgi:hypothetical protein